MQFSCATDSTLFYKEVFARRVAPSLVAAASPYMQQGIAASVAPTGRAARRLSQIGDRYRIGTTELTVTQPRRPCQTSSPSNPSTVRFSPNEPHGNSVPGAPA